MEEQPLEVQLAYMIGEELGQDPTSLQPPLNTVINIEALEELFADRENGLPRGDGIVRFRYQGLIVRIDSQGYVTIEEHTRGSQSAEPLVLGETAPTKLHF